jgi:glycosyltransferase involved in cell wall biosynthesis
MLSILIPIYNINCRGLVANLLLQCSEILKKYEVICIDDHSEDFFRNRNNTLQTLENVTYIELHENIGRAAIRNLLAEKAKYENLLFIDADSGIIRDDFIKKYLIYGNKEKVIYGGTEYQKNCPQDKSKILHWKYASQYEALRIQARIKKPFLAFMSNNFLIKKDIFMSVLFDTEHFGYGYEDTLFAEEIRKHSLSICHIDNPVEHTGLATADKFLSKSDEAMKNLARIYISGKMPETSLIRFYLILKKSKLDKFTAILIRQFLAILKWNLKSDYPILILFQLYKYFRFWNYLNAGQLTG